MSRWTPPRPVQRVDSIDVRRFSERLLPDQTWRLIGLCLLLILAVVATAGTNVPTARAAKSCPLETDSWGSVKIKNLRSCSEGYSIAAGVSRTDRCYTRTSCTVSPFKCQTRRLGEELWKARCTWRKSVVSLRFGS